jgi:hypothetical protein
MKIKATLLAVFVAGFGASFAVAKPPPGKGHGDKGPGKGRHGGDAATTGSTTSSTAATSDDDKKVLYCHKTGNGRYVLVRVSKHSAHARGKHKGDLPAVNGACPTAGTTTGTGTTGTTGTGTTGTTTGTTVGTTTQAP